MSGRQEIATRVAMTKNAFVQKKLVPLQSHIVEAYVWFIETAMNKKKLEVFETRYYRRLLRVSWIDSNIKVFTNVCCEIIERCHPSSYAGDV